MSSYIRQFRAYLRKNETAKGVFLVALVILGALAVWGGIRLALNTEYPILVVSSGSMCPPTNCVLPIGALIVIRGEDPSVIANRSIIVFRPYLSTPDFLVVHRVIQIISPDQNPSGGYVFITKGDNNVPRDTWLGFDGGVPGSQLVGVYQFTIPIPYLGQAILGIRDFMYDPNTGQPKSQGILVIVALIVALFAFEVMTPGKKPAIPDPQKEAEPAEPSANILLGNGDRGSEWLCILREE